MRTDKVALLTCEDDTGRLAAHYLAVRFAGLAVIVERKVARSLLLRRRIKRLGVVRVGGQLAFMAFQRVQHRASRGRIAEIVREANLDAPWPDASEMIRVPTVNSPECPARQRWCGEVRSTANNCSSTWSSASRNAPVAIASRPSADRLTRGGRRQ